MTTDAPIVLEPEQEAAVKLICEGGVGVITGAAGTGKTTVMHEATRRLHARAVSFELCAPTGKAARRLMEATGYPARTIHRMLGYRPGAGFQYNEYQELPTKVVATDEASMIDCWLARSLLDAVNPAVTSIFFMGDVNQLPPVGPGAFFRDLIESAVVPVVRLQTVRRAMQQSWVYRNAPKILLGGPMELDDIEDFSFYELENTDPTHIAPAVHRAVADLQAGGIDLDDIQVLSPMNDRPGGTTELNKFLQDRLNPRPPKEDAFQVYEHTMRINDRVIQTKNNYDLGVFNGEVGKVAAINLVRPKFGAGLWMGPKIVISFPDTPEDKLVAYTPNEATQLRPAYATSIHRFQGSEVAAAVVVCHPTHSFMLTRQLLYTAITRAKKRVCIVGTNKGIEQALRTTRDAGRRTNLVELLKTGAVK